MQPIAAADVAQAVADVSVGNPLQGIRTIAGPEVFPLDELGRITLAARGDHRTVTTDSSAGMFAAVPGDALIAQEGALIAPTEVVSGRGIAPIILVRLDDPWDRVGYFDERRSAFASKDLPKVYHLNIVVKISHTGTTAPRPARLELLRVILRKDGIARAAYAVPCFNPHLGLVPRPAQPCRTRPS